MLTDSSATSNDLISTTWSNVFLGTIVGAFMGAAIILFIGLLASLFLGLSAFMFLFFLGLWIPPALVGASASFLGGAVGLISKQRVYAVVTGLLIGVIVGLIYLSWQYSPNVTFTGLGIALVVAYGFAGALGSYYSTTTRAARVNIHYRKSLFTFLIVLLAIGITTRSLDYVRPQDCRMLCGETPCPPGACLAGEQRAGFPIPVLQDNMTGSSPTNGWGVLGPEDMPYPGAFVLDVIFWSAVLWFLWKVGGWIMSGTRRVVRQ